MKHLTLAVVAAFALALSSPAQQPGTVPGNPHTAPTAQTGNVPETTPQNAPAARKQSPKPALQQAPGGGSDKVWVNTNSSTYHCPGDRYYGKTAHGRYMTEAAAKGAGGHGVGGKSCFAGK